MKRVNKKFHHFSQSIERKEIRKNVYITDIENKISRVLMVKTDIKQLRNGGVIEIKFSSMDDLDRLVTIIMGGDDSGE